MMRPTANAFAAAVTLLLVTGALLACEAPRSSSGPSPTANSAAKARADTVYVDEIGRMTKAELYDRFMNRRMGRGRNAYWYGRAILETGDPGAVDSLVAYVDRYPGARYYVVEALAQEKVPALGTVLRRHGEDFDLAFWSAIGSALAHNGWRDPIVAEVLMEKVITTESQTIRCAATRAFVGMGTLEEVRTLASIGDTTSSACVAHFTTSAQARFNVPKFNRHVLETLLDTSRLHTRILEGVEENHRHDFLSELRTLRDQLTQSDPKRYLVYVEDLITELEAEKAEGIKPGAPLDYPNTTRADSTSTR